jgi:type I restriction enzyme S subunit
MKVAATSAEQLHESGRRLDASYHVSEGVKALHFIQQWADQPAQVPVPASRVLRDSAMAYSDRRVDALKEVCRPEGIFIPGRFKRIYVDDPDHGEPWLSPSDMLKADLSDLRLISRKYTPSIESLRVYQGWLLLSRSGTVGNLAYVREDMDGLVGSDDIIRIVADPEKIPPGYLYTFLTSPLGRALIEQKTYGAVVPHIEAHHVTDLPIPRLNWATEHQIHVSVEQAAALRVEANEELAGVNTETTSELGLPISFPTRYDHARAIGYSSVNSANLRLDAYYYVGFAGQPASMIHQLDGPLRELSEITVEIFNPPVFKRIYVGPDGMPYLMGYEVYESNPKPTRYLSRGTKDLEQYVLREGMIIIQDAGQRYGLLGTPIYANRTLDGKAATNNMIRIVSPDRSTAGYLFAFLNTEVGRRLIVRVSYGSSLPHIFPAWLGNIPIPWPGKDIRVKLGEQVVAAFDKRAEANDLENEAKALLGEELKVRESRRLNSLAAR